MNNNAFKEIGTHEQEKPIIAMNQAAYIFPGDTPAFSPVQEGKDLQQGVVILDTTFHMVQVHRAKLRKFQVACMHMSL
jgi:hypothetical protein